MPYHSTPAPILPNSQDLFSPKEVSALLRVPLSGVEAMLENGQLRYLRIADTVIIPKTFLEEFLASQEVPRYNAKQEQSFPKKHKGELIYLSASESSEPSLNLANSITLLDSSAISEGEPDMAKNYKFNQSINFPNGGKCWVTANTAQEFANKIITLSNTPATKTQFSDYAWKHYNTFVKPTIATTTAITYERQLKLHILPVLGELCLEDITTDHIQAVFNKMEGAANTTKNKVKNVLNPILEAAVEDGIISRNPMRSKKLNTKGKASKITPPYSVEQMKYLAAHIADIKRPSDQLFLTLMAFHPLRLEEALGLKRCDIDLDNNTLTVSRAVTHPSRNQPEIKETKTACSCRTLTLSKRIPPYITDIPEGHFLLGGETPLSYTQVRKMCDRIQRDTDFEERITPIRFRTTVLSDIYAKSKDVKLTQEAAGHTTAAMTMKYYAKNRENINRATAITDDLYSA